MSTKRINVNKNDEPALIAEKVIDAEADNLVLSIPKFSQFASAAVNFKLIKRQADLMKKSIIIESVDESVIELAKKSGLEAINPFFNKVPQRQVSDIVSRPKREVKRAPEKKKEIPPVSKVEVPGPQVVESILPEHLRVASVETAKSVGEPKMRVKKNRYPWQFKFGSIFQKKIGVLLGVLAALTLGAYTAIAVLPRAEITVKTEKKQWVFNDSVLIDKSLAATDSEKLRIPGQLFVQKNNATLKFPATGTKSIERKATGKIIIYNAYSSQAQQLVANTRLQTPDGKIFRLREAVNIPGAQIQEGKITPSSIEANIIADKAGAEYNVSAVPKLTIPGFSGTPKFSGFYGEIKQPTSGGFVGEAKIATESDIVKAKAEASRTLQSSIQTLLASQVPSDFKVLDGTSKFSITKQTIDEVGDANGNFSIFTEGEIAMMAFQEEDVMGLLTARAKASQEKDYQVKPVELIYEVVDADDPLAGKMKIGINYRAELSRVIDSEALLESMRGQKAEGLRIAVEGVNETEISLWPFWVRRVPDNPQKIKLVVE